MLFEGFMQYRSNKKAFVLVEQSYIEWCACNILAWFNFSFVKIFRLKYCENLEVTSTLLLASHNETCEVKVYWSCSSDNMIQNKCISQKFDLNKIKALYAIIMIDSHYEWRFRMDYFGTKQKNVWWTFEINWILRNYVEIGNKLEMHMFVSFDCDFLLINFYE